MIHNLTITSDESASPFLPANEPHMTWKPLVNYEAFTMQASVFSMSSQRNAFNTRTLPRALKNPRFL